MRDTLVKDMVETNKNKIKNKIKNKNIFSKSKALRESKPYSLDIVKVAFAVLFILGSSYLVHNHILVPILFLYGLPEYYLFSITAIIAILSLLVFIPRCKNKEYSRYDDYDLVILDSAKKQPNLTKEEASKIISQKFADLEYSLKNKNPEAARQQYYSITDMVKYAPIKKRRSFQKRCSIADKKIKEAERSLTNI